MKAFIPFLLALFATALFAKDYQVYGEYGRSYAGIGDVSDVRGLCIYQCAPKERVPIDIRQDGAYRVSAIGDYSQYHSYLLTSSASV